MAESAEHSGSKKSRSYKWIVILVIVLVIVIILPNALFLPLLETEKTDYRIISKSCTPDEGSTLCEGTLRAGIEGHYYITIRLYDDFDTSSNGTGKHLESQGIWDFEVEFPNMASEEYTLTVNAPTKKEHKSVYEVLTEND